MNILTSCVLITSSISLYTDINVMRSVTVSGQYVSHQKKLLDYVKVFSTHHKNPFNLLIAEHVPEIKLLVSVFSEVSFCYLGM